MALAATLDQEGFDALDEGLQAQYEETKGRYVLQVEGIKEHPTVSGLQKAYETEKRRANERSDKLKAFGDLTPDDITTLQAEVEELREKKEDGLISAEDLQSLKEKQKELARRAKEADELEARVQFFETDQETRLRNEIRGALAEAGVKPEAARSLSLEIQEDYNARYERGEKGFNAVVTGELNGVPGDHGLSEFVSEFVKGPGAWAVPASGKGGSGADPNARNGAPTTQGGVKQVRMQGTTVRADPSEILAGKAQVVPE